MTNFGYSTIGASNDNPAGNWIWVKATSTPAASGLLTSISAYLGPKQGSPTVCMGLYSQVSNLPAVRLASNETPVSVGGSFGWITQTQNYQLVAGTQYWFALRIKNNTPTGADAYCKYDTNGSLAELKYAYGQGDTPLPANAPALSSVSNERWSVYGTYNAGQHVVTGRGNFAIVAPAYLKVALAGIPSVAQYGAAEPKNYYHVGMIRWGTANGVMTAWPITSDLELIPLPAGMTILYYEFAPGITATIDERSTV